MTAIENPSSQPNERYASLHKQSSSTEIKNSQTSSKSSNANKVAPIDSSTQPSVAATADKTKETVETAGSFRPTGYQMSAPHQPIARTFTRSKAADVISKMQSELNVHLPPDRVNDAPETLDSQKMIVPEKQAFLKEHMPVNTMRLVLSQKSYFPIIQAAVNELADTYEKWGELPEEEVSLLKSKLALQHQNLNKLCHLFESLEKKGNGRALMELTLLHSAQISMLTPYIKGERPLQRSDINNISKIIQTQITMLEKDPLQLSSKDEIKAKRKASPITTTIIKKEADLFAAVRIGKVWAVNQFSLDNAKLSLNRVVKLKDPNTNETMAYFKESRHHEIGTPIMEKLVWDIAGVLKHDEQFVSTGIVDLQTESETYTPNITTILENGELVEIWGLSEPRRGGIQPAAGQTLVDYKNNNDPNKPRISKQQLIKATVTSAVFGMFDLANPRNILVNDQGELLFFDNTRSLPNANSILFWGGRFICPYNSNLLSLGGNYTRLTENERAQIKSELALYESKMPDLKNHLKLASTQKQLSKLPPSWFDEKGIIEAMEERIQLLKQAIDDPKVENLRDLLFASNPDFKYVATLELTYALWQDHEKKLSLRHIQQNSFSVHFDNVERLVERIAGINLSAELIRSWCQDPNLSYAEVMKLIEVYVDKVVAQSADPESSQRLRNQAQLHAENVIDDMKRKAHLDNKDLRSGEQDLREVYEFLQNQFIKFGYRPTHMSMRTFHDQFFSYKNYNPGLSPRINIDDETYPPSFTLNFNNGLDGFTTFEIDYMSAPGYVKIGDFVVSVEQLVEAFQVDFKTPFTPTPLQKALLIHPTIYKISEKKAHDILNGQPEGTYLVRNAESSNIAIDYVDSKGDIQTLHIKRSKGGFALEGEEEPIIYGTLARLIESSGKLETPF